MPIECRTPRAEIERMLENHVERLTEALVYNLCEIGEQVLIAARSTNSYKDQTGNLRSSVGYIVAIDGEVVRMSDFEPSERGTDKTTGQNTGKTYAQKLIEKYPKGIVLLVVAGMKYASYVSAKGLDVLDSSELLAERLILQMLKQLGLK